MPQGEHIVKISAAQDAETPDVNPFARFDAIALDIVDEARSSLMMAFRFLNAALWRMPVKTAPLMYPFATNGSSLMVGSVALVARFREDYNQVVRDLLHATLHCVFRHPYDTEHLNVSAWSLACDIVVESVALEMCETRFPAPGDADKLRELHLLEKALGTITPMKLYRLFANGEVNEERTVAQGYNAARIWDLRQLFHRDDHQGWANQKDPDDQGAEAEGEEEGSVRKRNLSDRLQDSENDLVSPDDLPKQQEEGEEGSSFEDPREEDDGQPDQVSNQIEEDDSDMPKSLEVEAEDNQEDDSNNQADSGSDQAPSSEGQDTSDSSSNQAAEAGLPQEDEATEDDWEQIAKQLEEDLETFSKNYMGGAGSLLTNLTIANRRTVNYSEFLRQFSAMGEDMRINDDEFDYIFYTYGLDVYGNMPLVEPLEYTEHNRIREFVIAIDTSGSCYSELTQQFVTRTYEILQENEEFGDKVNIHIIQCDAAIQTDLKIEKAEDLEKYCKNFQIYGSGGTDFRPVFEYVDKLIEEGEFENLRGLIYFTDGCGMFPTKMPSYETAFVFMDDGTPPAKVPPWAMRVLLDEDEIRKL